MAKYVFFFSYTSEAWQRMIMTPGNRSAAIRHLIETLGGVMTTVALRREDDVRALFGIPATVAVAALVVLGRPVTAQDLDPATALHGLPAGFERDGLAAMFADYTAHGFHGGNNLILRTILGRPPRSLDSFFAELAR